MERKLKIGIVCGESFQPRFLSLFEPLRDAFDTCIYAHHQERLIDLHGTGMKLRLFENITDMPGFMRGLEDELADVDLIIGVENSRLATFQALRAARKFGTPFCVLVNEFLPYFYEKFANIRAIQFDVFNKAEHFWVTSQAAHHTLRLDHVPAESISYIPPIIDTKKLKFSSDGRRRFREYVGIGSGDLVVLYQHELVPANRPDELIKSLALLKRQLGDLAETVKILCVGQGAATMDLKYLAYDLGLGKQAMFLHQDPEPFLHDLYSSSDIMFEPRPQVGDFHQDIPLSLLEGMAFGLLPMVGAGSVAAEFAAGFGRVYSEDTHQSIAAQMQDIVLNRKQLDAQRIAIVQHVDTKHARAAVGQHFVASVEAIIRASTQRSSPQSRAKTILTQIAGQLKAGALSEAIMTIEEALLFDFISISDRVELYRLKGDAYFAGGQIDSACNSYNDGLMADEHSFLCLRGLGNVAWQSHDHEAALGYYRRALALNDGDADTLLGIAMVFRRLGLHEEAVVWLEKCVIEHNIPAATIALAQTCSQLSRVGTAIDILARVLDAVGDNHTLMTTLGHLYLNSGRTDEGHALLRKALDAA